MVAGPVICSGRHSRGRRVKNSIVLEVPFSPGQVSVPEGRRRTCSTTLNDHRARVIRRSKWEGGRRSGLKGAQAALGAGYLPHLIGPRDPLLDRLAMIGPILREGTVAVRGTSA